MKNQREYTSERINNAGWIADVLATIPSHKEVDTDPFSYREEPIDYFTVVVDTDDQERVTKKELDAAIKRRLGNLGRYAISGELMDVSVREKYSAEVTAFPATEQEIQKWKKIHAQHTLLALDDDEANIEERLRAGSMVVVVGENITGTLKEKSAQEFYREHVDAQPSKAPGRAGFGTRPTRRGALAINSNNWDGFLGGGSPKNPLRVGGISYR